MANPQPHTRDRRAPRTALKHLLSPPGLGLLLGLLVVWGVALREIEVDRVHTVREAQTRTAAQAELMAQAARSTLRRVDGYLLDIRDSWHADLPEFAALVHRHQGSVSDIAFQVGVIDAFGRLAFTNLAAPAPPIDLQDRPHFTFHRDGAGADRLFISDPVEGRISSRWSLQLTRPILRSGRFDGVVVISLDPLQLVGPGSGSADGATRRVVKDSGAVLAWQSNPDPAPPGPGRSRPGRASSPAASAGAAPGAPIDEADAVHGRFGLAEYGLQFVVSEPMSAVLHAHEPYRLRVLVTAALISVLQLVLYAFLRLWNNERQRVAHERNLASLVYESSSEGMIVVDANGIVVSVNPAFTVVTGFTAAEVLGSRADRFRSARHTDDFYATALAGLASAGRWQGEVWSARKDGADFPAQLTINASAGARGSGRRYVGLFYDISEQKRSQELAWKHANCDVLTGLPNRRMFGDRLAQEIRRSQRSKLPLALMFLDLDGFKGVNDSLGHDLGDALLIEVARRLTSSVRQSDTVARLGGDEFTLIMGELTRPQAVHRVVDDILARLSQPYQLGDEQVFVTASIGVAFCPEDGADPDSLVKNADQAMFAAKTEGRNRACYFTPALQASAQARLRLSGELRTALAQGEFVVFYQPVVDLRSGRIAMAEALLRWQHPTRGLVGPADFLPIAEETGLIVDIGHWVIGQALRQVGAWRERIGTDFRIGVNMSALQFQRDGAVTAAALPQRIRDHALPCDSIVVEITETSVMEPRARVPEHLAAFRAAGMKVALDDFGTGCSSLSYLRRLEIDFLKIDRSFVSRLSAGSDDMALCEAIIVMAHKLGIRVVAEGVETADQRDLLATAGCDFAQGFHFARPAPAAEFERLVRARQPAAALPQHA